MPLYSVTVIHDTLVVAATPAAAERAAKSFLQHEAAEELAHAHASANEVTAANIEAADRGVTPWGGDGRTCAQYVTGTAPIADRDAASRQVPLFEEP